MSKRRFGSKTALAGLLLLLAGAIAQAMPEVPALELKITVTPSVVLYGEPFSIKVTGLRPAGRATVKAASRDARQVLWESAADFEADAAGTIDLSHQAPVSGAYAEADIFGLLWSLQPVMTDPNKKKPSFYSNDEVNGWTVDLSAKDSAGNTGSTRLRCVYQMPGQGLVRIPLEQDGLYGFLYTPSKGGPFPGVIILGGANGGLYEWLAQAFASNGFAALTLAYFGYRDLPAELVEIPLEQFPRAAAWLRAQPSVRPDRIGLVGGSKGGELALLLASRFNGFHAVVGWVPGAHVWEGLTKKFFSPDYQPVSSWSLNGQPLPFVSLKVAAEDKMKEMKGELNSYLHFYANTLAQAEPGVIERALIPVEKIQAPILLVSGTDDQTWPSDAFCLSIMDRLKKARFPYEAKHLSNENGGHQSFLPYFITVGRGWISGGTPQADARGGYRSWAETIVFLHRHLDK